MRQRYAKITCLILISFLALFAFGCGESGTPGGATGPGVTASIALNAGLDSMPADGVTSTTITAVLRDSSNAPVSERTAVVFRTTRGTFRNGSQEYRVKIPDASGSVSVTLIADSSSGTAKVSAESNSISQKIDVRFYDPGKVGTITLRTGAASITADGKSRVAVIATVEDNLGNAEEGAEVTFKTTLGEFVEANPLPGIINRTTTADTDVDGEAAVMLVSGKTIGTATILASINGMNATATVTFTADEPHTITLRAAPSTIKPNGTSTLFARLLDINGNPVANRNVVFSQAVNATEGTLNILTASTNVNGEAQSTYIGGNDEGTDILQAALASNLDMKAQTSVTVDPGAIVIAGIDVTTGAATLVADGTSQVKVRAIVTDIDGNRARGKTVRFTTTAGTLSSATATTSDTGIAEVMLRSTTIAGPVTVRADCDGFIDEAAVEFVPGPAHHIIMYAFPNVVPPNGPFQTAAIVQDQYDNRIDDQRLMLQVRRAGHPEIVDTAEMTPAQAEDGVFRFDWTAARAYGEGNLEITARVNNGVSKTVTVVVDETATIVGSITLIAGAEEVKADGTSSVLIRATVLDYDGNPAEGITVNFATTLGSLSAQQKKTGANGIADVMLKAGTTWGTATVTADANGFWNEVDVRFTSLKAGGVSLTTMPKVVKPGGQATVIAELRDDRGAPVPNQVLYFDIYENNTGATLSAIQGSTDTNGRVTITYTAGVYLDDLCGICACSGDRIRVTLASDSSITDTTCVTVAVFTGDVGYLTLTSDVTTLPADGISSTAVRATAYDTAGFPMPQGTPIKLTTTLGSFPGGVTTITLDTIDDSGTVITSLMAGAVGGVAEITASCGGVSQLLYIIINDGSVSVGSILLSADPTSLPNDGASSTAVTAVVRDTGGNPVPFGTPVVFSIDPALGCTFPNGMTSIVVNTPDASGTVTTSLMAGLQDGVLLLTAAAGSLTQAIEIPILETVTGGLTLTANPNSIVANGISTSLIRATLTDAEGNPLPGVDVTFSTTLGTIIGGPTVTTNASGIADVTLRSTETTGTATVSASANGITTTVNVTFRSGAPGELILAAAPETVNPGGGACNTSCCESTSTLTATLLDTEGNPMAGQTITFLVTGNDSGATLSAPSAVTNINGQATVTYTAGNLAGTDTVTARSVTDTTIYDDVEIEVDASTLVVGSITVTSGATSLVADGLSTTVIRATVRDNCGNPMVGYTVNFATTLGTVDGNATATADTNTSGIAQVTLQSTDTTGTATVTAEASGFIGTVNVQFVAGVADELTLVPGPSTVNPGGTSTLTATLLDASDNPLVNQTITFVIAANSSGATLSAPSAVTNINGQATVTYTAGPGFGTDTIRAASLSDASVYAEEDITVDASAIVIGSITLTANPTSIPADETSSSAITATLRDTSNNPMPIGTTVEFTTTLGTFPNGTDTQSFTINNAGGTILTSLISAETPGTAIVTATYDGVSQSVIVTMTGGGLVVTQLEVIIEKTSLNADGVSKTNVYAYAKTEQNQAVPNVSITFETSDGTITTPHTTDANGRATAVLTSARENIDPVVVTARYNLVSATATMRFTGVTLTLAANPTSQVLGQNSTITATLRDAASQPIAGATVDFSTSHPGDAVVAPASQTTNASGVATVVLTNSNISGPVTVTGLSRGATGSVVVNYGEFQLSFEPSEPGIINVGGGAGGTSIITARLKEFGAGLTCPGGVTPVTINFSSTLGTITPIPVYSFTLTAAASADAGATYTNNAQTFTVLKSITGETVLSATGTGAPSAAPGTLTRTSPAGTGDATIDYTAWVLTAPGETGACTSVAGTTLYADAFATLVSGAQGGTATINAYADIGDPSVRYNATTSVSIISPTANKIILEADPSVISVNTGVSTIRARVLDSADNPVANRIIYFRILQGPGGSEYLTPSFATTDADGRCVASFHAGSIPSDNIGDVIIQASDNQTFVDPSLGSCNLTIAGQVHHVAVGVNLQELPAPAVTQGHLQVGVSGIATDINGNPVADGTQIYFSVKSIAFDEDRDYDQTINCRNAAGTIFCSGTDCDPADPGFCFPGETAATLGTNWFSDDINQDGVMYGQSTLLNQYPFAGTEDTNGNGILDPGEDRNGNGVLDPPQGCSITSPQTTTDGVARTFLVYPMSYADNIRVRITASAGGKTNFYDYTLLCTETMVDQGTCGLGY